ncbi:hypothetical protein [Streptomyces mobaraensis]|uniref:Uncharacterized protein n=1 Tax=Streptomyces mobaraensis TaxID=35621 RepID=A0A5N5WCR1_STRMB|nr:hypothetical protein [Streptomyces mobaraensis]KAB7850136.1 hypothetical protein FRZ00_05915 [Streptomyces mobaraensis]
MSWQRRLTDAEFAAHSAWEQDRRDRAALLADPQQPPAFGPMPQPEECTTQVFACADHALSLDAAARIHRATCTAPAAADLPDCDCVPEPAPSAEPETTADNFAAVLPPGWN